MAVSKERKAEIVKQFGKNEKDPGSVQVQVALLTDQIKALTAHLKANHKDANSKRSLMILVGQRKNLLSYLWNKEIILISILIIIKITSYIFIFKIIYLKSIFLTLFCNSGLI